MKSIRLGFVTVAATLLLMSFIKLKPITIFMIGDSTMANKKPETFPENGWGMAFGQYFDKTVTIDNRAQNGRSTKSFIAENRWQPVVDKLEEGDYVFIEFGHNDEKIDKPLVGTSLAEFRTNLTKFVLETRAKNAYPVLLTPTARRNFKDGELKETHFGYPEVVRSLADSLKVPMIDMLAKTRKIIIAAGDASSKQWYNYVDSGHVNYPKGKKDDTHFSQAGAVKMAGLAVEGIKELKLGLAQRLIQQ
ncbi:MAG: rhamnogalacturonan acetylesterase [Bacteroidota bacterium]